MDAPDDGGGPAGVVEVVEKLSSKFEALPLPFRVFSGVEGREGDERFEEQLAMLAVESFFCMRGRPGLIISSSGGGFGLRKQLQRL